MKKGNIIAILIVVFVVLLGVLYLLQKNKSTNEYRNNMKNTSKPLVCKNRVGKTMSYDTALDIAQNSQTCMSVGKIKEEKENHRCGAFPDFIAIPLEVKDKPGCNPHCLVNIDTHETEVNWMCTGVI